MTMRIGDTIAFCYAGTHGSRRLRNATVTKVMKTYIEIDDGSRFSAKDMRMIRSSNGDKSHNRYFYIEAEVAFWDGKEARDKALRELNTGFENLISAARDRNWEQVKSCFSALSGLIGE